MIFIVVILFVAYILIPLLDLITRPNILYACKVILYAVVTIWFLWEFFGVHKGLI
jgi:hypothetical protein